MTEPERLSPVPATPEATEAAPPDAMAPPADPPAAPLMERPHPATPIIKGWMALVGLAFVVGQDVVENLGKSGGAQALSLRDLGFLGALLAAYVVLTGIVGYFSWRFTRFVVDDHQLRIEHNFIQHNSDQVPFTKIQSVDVVQPLAARLLGLAQLRIDVGSGAGKTIEYLGRARAYQMRDYLVARAHGHQVTVEQSAASRGTADILHDLAPDERVLLRVPPQRLVLAAVLSSGFLITLVLSAVAIASMVWFRQFGALVGVIPLVSGLVTIIGNDVIKQWNYSLVRSGQALKVSRGMTSLVSQTLPTSRIQGLQITQHQLWRPFGLYRVKMDVLGYGGGDAEKEASDVLLPAGTWQEVELAIDAVWPGFRLSSIEMHGVDRRVRTIHPFIWKSFQWGLDDDVIVARNGGLVHETKIVHHARVQSVHLKAGPVQRRMGLADVQVDTTAGIFGTCTLQELDAPLARTLVLDEMDRCREARRRDAQRAALDALPAPQPPDPAEQPTSPVPEPDALPPADPGPYPPPDSPWARPKV
ncbi:PH domain-containing protein [Luteococcus sp. Sow4_B9]|uniref:PH domain-containing protein n=1 Tax=Luteococcus sp. Sow4_B9 TaxID=3438792 RepID=UPI003F96E47F